MGELKSWAERVVEHRHSDSNCPVCGTQFGPGELMQRMQTLALAPSDAAVSELRQRLELLDAERQKLAAEASWLSQLDKFARTFPDDDAPLTVRDTHLAASRTIERRQVLLDAVGTAKKGLDAYAKSGLSLVSIEQLCMPLEGRVRQAPASLDVVGAIEDVKQYLHQLVRAIEDLDARVRQRGQRLRALLDEAGVQGSGSLQADIEQLMVRQRVAGQASAACAAARGLLDFAPDADMRSLLTSLEAAVLGAKRVQAAMLADSSSATRLATVREQVAQLSERLVRLSATLERLAGAQRVLDDIIENQSLDAASAAVVAATHKVADSIFGRIHAPAEYLVSAEAEAPLRRRENNAPIQLNEVSTGQRSAYALSMFLAMNAQVKAGPKVILLDDPISHIDDLNALSFLDYLRNLVIKSDRQVFFATADEKIAGLFVHKFGFLGEGFRTIELARG
jgi:exonuclease SbcC